MQYFPQECTTKAVMHEDLWQSFVYPNRFIDILSSLFCLFVLFSVKAQAVSPSYTYAFFINQLLLISTFKEQTRCWVPHRADSGESVLAKKEISWGTLD